MALPQAPDPYSDAESIRALVKKKHTAWTNPRPRAQFLQAAKGNLLYLQGEHWIRPAFNAYGDWRPAVVKKGTPLPVTNLYAAVMKTFSSMLARFEPSLTFRPATDEPEDRATADVSSRVIDVVQEEVEIVPVRQKLANWVAHTGGAWLETGWDASMTHGTVNLPMESCQMCGEERLTGKEPTCDADMGGGPCGGPMAPMLDEAGAPVMQAMPRGKMFAEIRSLFEVVFDPFQGDPSKHDMLIVQKSIDVDDAKARWSNFADSIAADSMATGQTLTQDSLSMIAPNLGDMMGGSRMSWQAQGGQQNSRVTETWVWKMPDETYPDGLLVVYLGKGFETEVHPAGPLPYYAPGQNGDRTYFLPLVFFPQELVPGSAWPKTVANDVRPKNAQRNLWESLILMAGQRISNPVWMVPMSAKATNTFTGEPGQIIYWNDMNGGKPPAVQQGASINTTWMANVERIDKEIQELTAIFEVLSGNRPEGISAGIALQILKERGESRFGPMFQLWHHAWAQWAKQAIEIFRMFATEERILKIKGRDGEWEVSKFFNSDLSGRIDVIPEAGMSMPKSTMTDRATMEQLAAMGVINPMGDVEHRMAVLKEYGMLHVFSPGMELETKNAIIENEMFEQLAMQPAVAGTNPQTIRQLGQMGDPMMAAGQIDMAAGQLGVQGMPTVRPSIDDHGAHSREHRNFARSERFRKLPPPVQAIVEMHIAAHDFLVGQQMMAMQNARAGTAPNSGFNAMPGPQKSPLSAGSSGSRMEGDNQEGERKVGAAG